MNFLVIAVNQAKEPYPVMPVGAIMLSDLLEKRGDNVRLLDLCFSPDPHAALRAALSVPTDTVLISFRNLNNHDLRHARSYLPLLVTLVNEVKKKGIPFYIGGSATAIAADEIFVKTGADGVFVGSAKSFVNRLNQGAPIDGVVQDWAAESYIPHNIERWIDADRYLKYERMAPLRFKRGCPYQCSYCNYQALEGAHDRLEPDEELAHFIRHWHEREVCIDIVDSVFNTPEKWVIEICDWLAERDLAGPYHISAFTPAVKSAATLKALASVGMTQGMIGLDGGSDTMLAAYKKPFRMAEVDRFLAMRADYDFRFLWTFIVGGPGESDTTLEEMMRFVNRLPKSDPVYISNGVRLYPGTDLYEKLTLSGEVIPNGSATEPLYYFSPLLDPERVDEQLREWSDGNDNVLLGGETYDPSYQKALEKAVMFGVQTPGWRNMPVIKKLMRRYAAR